MFDVDVELGDELRIGGLSVFPLTGAHETWTGLPDRTRGVRGGDDPGEWLDPPEGPSLGDLQPRSGPDSPCGGEMLIGGDQNRTMNVTVLCPPQVRTVVPVSCVEAGRWERGEMVSPSSKHAPGSLRAAKTAKLEPRSDDVSSRRSDQGLIWHEVERSRWRTTSLGDVRPRRRPGGVRGPPCSRAGEDPKCAWPDRRDLCHR